MSGIVINGGRSLHGEVVVQGSKNAALPIMAATLLNRGISILKNYPNIEDVNQMQALLESVGCNIIIEDDEMIIDSANSADATLPESITGKIRASSVMLGAMLGRFHHVKMPQPGGCRIGKRPLDIHMNVFKAFGASWEINEDYIEVECTKLHGADIRLRFKSVGATENAIIVAAAANGNSVIRNAAMEPEIKALCDYLRGTGINITGDGTEVICVTGGECHDVFYEIEGDRIVAGTYMAAVTACMGDICLSGIELSHCRGFLDVFTGMGMELDGCYHGMCRISMNKRASSINCIKTEPYPGFPTDMQPIIMSCASLADGTTVIEENIFDNRFGIIRYLSKMGADIHIDGSCALIKGVSYLNGTEVEAEDLRGAAALVIAGLSAQGKTRITQLEYLDRGYYNLWQTLNRLGADIHGE